MNKDVFVVERNVHGAWAIYGSLGVRQYYGYTKAEAVRKYKEEAAGKIMREVKK